jgi:single-stranded DNA-binding protein
MFGIQVAFECRLVAEPEAKTSQNGNRWTRARAAVDTGADRGSRDERNPAAIQWVGVRAFREQASQLGALRKGDRVYVEGKLDLPVRTYEGRDGSTQAAVDVVIDRVVPLGKLGQSAEEHAKRAAANGEAAIYSKAQQAAHEAKLAAEFKPDSFDDLDDSIPF